MSIRTAVVGLGPQGQRLVKIVKRLPELELTGVADHKAAAMDAAALNGCVRAPGLKELLGLAGRLDAVLIATNGPSHAELAELALEAGARFVLVEKPMATSVAECLRIEAAAVRAGARLAVNHGLRHDPLHGWLKEKIASGKWGKLRSIFIQRPGIGLGCLGTHSIDQVHWLSGRRVRSVTAWIDEPRRANPRGAEFRDPGGLLVLDLGDGARAVVSQIEDGSGPMAVEIDLQGARVRVDPKLGEAQVLERDLAVAPGPDRPPVYAKAEVPPGMAAAPDLYALSEAVIRELIGSGPMRCAPEVGRDTIAVLAAGYLSHERGHAPVDPASLSDAERARALAIT